MDLQNPAPAAPDGTPPPTGPPAPDTVIAPTTPPEPEVSLYSEAPDPTPAEAPAAPETPTPSPQQTSATAVEDPGQTAPEATSQQAPAPAPAEAAEQPAAPVSSAQPPAPPPAQPVAPASAQPATPAALADKPADKPTNPKTHVPDTLPVTQTDEHTVCVVRRHPIGIIGTYVMCAVIAIVTAVLAFIVVPGLVSKASGSSVLMGGTLVFVVIAAACAAFAFIAGKVYWGNSWTVTTDSLTQVRRFSLFNRQSSQLSLKDLEDVTAGQEGVIARIFNFGTLRVETAGESSKFIFPFCPNPNYYAQQILQARESFERNRTAEENTYQKTP